MTEPGRALWKPGKYVQNSEQDKSENRTYTTSMSPVLFRLTYVFKRSCAPSVARNLAAARSQPRILTSPKCAAATRPGRTGIGESRDCSFSGRLAESAKTRGASESEPAALKVQLGAVGAKLRGFANSVFFYLSPEIMPPRSRPGNVDGP